MLSVRVVSKHTTYAAATHVRTGERHAFPSHTGEFSHGDISPTACGLPVANLRYDPNDDTWPGEGAHCPACLEKTS